MGAIGTTTILRFPHLTSGAEAMRRAHKRCPPETHDVIAVYPMPNGRGYEAEVRRVAHPNSVADYRAAVRAHEARPDKFARPNPSAFSDPIGPDDDDGPQDNATSS